MFQEVVMIVYLPKKKGNEEKSSTWLNNVYYWGVHLGAFSLLLVNIIMMLPHLKAWSQALPDVFVAFP